LSRLYVQAGNTRAKQALAKNYLTKNNFDIRVQSRGVNIDRGEFAPEEGTITVLKERGLDISSHQVTQLTEQDITHSTYLLTMT